MPLKPSGLLKTFIVTINWKLPYISVSVRPVWPQDYMKPKRHWYFEEKQEWYTLQELILSGDLGVFFAQGEDADSMLSEIPDDCNPEEYLIQHLESSGAMGAG